MAKAGVASSGGGGGRAGLGDRDGVPAGGTAAPRAGLGAGPKLPDFQEKPGNWVVKVEIRVEMRWKSFLVRDGEGKGWEVG